MSETMQNITTLFLLYYCSKRLQLYHVKSDNGEASASIYIRNVCKINIFFGKYSSTYDSSTSLETKLMAWSGMYIIT